MTVEEEVEEFLGEWHMLEDEEIPLVSQYLKEWREEDEMFGYEPDDAYQYVLQLRRPTKCANPAHEGALNWPSFGVYMPFCSITCREDYFSQFGGKAAYYVDAENNHHFSTAVQRMPFDPGRPHP